MINSHGAHRWFPRPRNLAFTWSTAATSLWLLLACADADAADQGITGKKLLLKSAGKLLLLSKDSSIAIVGSNPVGGSNSSISFDNGSTEVTFGLPTTHWSANGSGTLFKYKNPAAPGGPSAVQVSRLKAGLLKVGAKGLPFAVPNGAATIDVVFRLDGGTNTFCMKFTGTGDGSKFLVKDAGAGACVTCGNNVREGSEVCDGTDATACPNDCQSDCTCAPACPTSGGNATACLSVLAVNTACDNCCGLDQNCEAQCNSAAGAGCTNAGFNDACAAAANAAGCAAECCPVCGDGAVVVPEQCDPPGNTTQCAGSTACSLNCTCPPPPATCAESFPTCDGTCPSGGNCIPVLGGCVCDAGDCVGGSAPPTCGGTCPAEYSCLGFVNDCECLQPVCGDGLVMDPEECDPPGSTVFCPGNGPCSADCRCLCGNNVREGTEVCDGTDDAACPGNCLPSCTCGACAFNPFPTCSAGACPPGKTCQSLIVISETGSVPFCASSTTSFCGCVPSDVSCDDPSLPCGDLAYAGTCPANHACLRTEFPTPQCDLYCPPLIPGPEPPLCCGLPGASCSTFGDCCSSVCAGGACQ